MHPTKQAAALAFAFDNAITRAVMQYRRRADHGPDLAGPFIRREARRQAVGSVSPAQAVSRACRAFETRHVVRRGAWTETRAVIAA